MNGGPCWSGQEKQIPLEVVERIGQYLDGTSLIRMAATDSFMRKAAHHVVVLRLDSLAKEYPDLGDSLARMGWTKAGASKHDLAECRCFHLLVICVWNSFEFRSKAVMTSNIKECLVTSRNGIFATSSGLKKQRNLATKDIVTEIHLESINRESLERRILMTEEREGFMGGAQRNQIANFENTLVFRSRVELEEGSAGFKKGQYSLTIWNSKSLARVGEIDLINQKVKHKWKEAKAETSVGKIYSDVDLKDEEVLKDLEIGNIVVTENTIVVHFMKSNPILLPVSFYEQIETWIFKINTKDPKMKDLVLERVLREPIKANFLCSGDPSNIVQVTANNCYLVRLGQSGLAPGWRKPELKPGEEQSETEGGVCIIQHFNLNSHSSGSEDVEGVKADVEVQGGIRSKRSNSNQPTLDRPTLHVREAKLCQVRDSPLIALGIEVFEETGRRGINGQPERKDIIQVMNIETREVLMQHPFWWNSHWERGGIDGKLKICWVGSQLLVAYKKKRGIVVDRLLKVKDELSLFSWQEGAVDLLPTAITIEIGPFNDTYRNEFDLLDMFGNLQEIIMIIGERYRSKQSIYKFAPKVLK